MYRSERVSSRGKNEQAPKKNAPLVQKIAHRGAKFCTPMRKNLHQQREKTQAMRRSVLSDGMITESPLQWVWGFLRPEGATLHSPGQSEETEFPNGTLGNPVRGGSLRPERAANCTRGNAPLNFLPTSP